MSNSTINTILDRIRYATPESRIAVFKRSTFDNIIKEKNSIKEDQSLMLDAVFADTVDTLRHIEASDKNLIGVYHSGDNAKEIKRDLKAALIEG